MINITLILLGYIWPIMTSCVTTGNNCHHATFFKIKVQNEKSKYKRASGGLNW